MHLQKNFLLLATASMALGLGGCAQKEVKPAEGGYSNQLLFEYVQTVKEQRRPGLEQTGKASMTVERNGAVVSTAPLPPVKRAPSDLQRLVTVMPGDIEEQVVAIAGQMPGWSILPPAGVKTGTVTAQIRMIGRTAYEALRDISAAVGASADVVVNESKKTIQIVYPER